MNEKLYDLMDWAGIEALVYSEEDNPHQYLGPLVTEEGVVFRAFFPDAKEAFVLIGEAKQPLEMVQEDEAGYFAAMINGNEIPEYSYRAVYEDGEEEYGDPYAFAPQITEKDTKKFNAGISYEVYKILGAHPMTIDGSEGVYFAVWAPFAMRVSVVGDFNRWDGRMHPMRRLWNSGIFELFVPGISKGTLYKFEIKAKGGLTYLKADPYANASELRPDTASIVTDLDEFSWSDEKWLARRAETQAKDAPMAVYEVDLATFDRPARAAVSQTAQGDALIAVHEGNSDAERNTAQENNADTDDAASSENAVAAPEFYNYRELAVKIADYVKEMGYTHIELLPVMEHTSDESLGYEVTGYYAPTSRFGTPADFMYFMNYMHEQGIGVILDWVPSQFPRDTHGLAAFDGTYLYEHMDPRKGVHPRHNTLLYNYGRPEVSNFLIANALFWKNVYHADGLRMDSVASMLYLDYDRKYGQWVPNMYGGNENLDAVEFFKHLNSIFKKQGDGAILIAEDSSTWPKLTAPVEDGGLGFDYKWNTGFTNDLIGYMQLDPYFRSRHHEELTLGMLYAYSEDFIVGFSHDVVVNGQGSMYSKMPGKSKMKFANLRAVYGYLMAHPGKKHLFMGQEFGQPSEWSCSTVIPWELLKQEEHQQMKAYVQALLALYRSQPALYQKDYDLEGFAWMDTLSANENTIVFLRRGAAGSDDLLVVCNFSPVAHEKYQIGVPYGGKYKEIFNSDATSFGGSGKTNPRVKASKKEICDDREDSIRIQVPPMGIVIFKCTKDEAVRSAAGENAEDTKPSAKKAVQKKTSAKTAAAGKTVAGKPAAEKATEETKSSPKGAAEKAITEEKSSAKKAAASEKTSAKKTAANTAAGEKPAAKKAVKTAAGEKTAVKKTVKAEAEEKPATKKAEKTTARKSVAKKTNTGAASAKTAAKQTTA
ncbi:MAG: 1,4-alpha-glucan branching protein GlgB [Lachnospiraceae bacterium]|nr:1,4-alpha-glucan branching protein GlgB [Lachnospiraceae bacterium]